MLKKSLCFCIVSMLLLVSGNVFAQNAQELRFGSFLSGNLSGNEVWYRITASEAGFATIEITSGIDTYLEIYDAQRNLIMEDDDSGSDYNAKAEFPVTRGTSYLIKVRGYDSSATGQYRILASISTPTQLNVGANVSGTISPGGSYFYSVRTTQNGFLIVETTGSTDTYLEAFDSSNTRVAENDDGGVNTNARIEIVVQANQTYYFKVRGYNNEERGQFTVRASYMQIPTATQLGIGNYLSGNISSGESYWYSVRATQNGMLIVETTGGTDTYLEAYNSNYGKITENDDGGENSNARIEIATQANQTYFFKLRGYDSGTAGSYRILASLESLPAATPLGIGAFLSGNISNGGSYWYSVRTTQRGTLIVETTSGIDTYLEAFNSNYEKIAEDDDSGDNNNARVEISVQANQTYYFKLRGYNSSTTGSYRILASTR